MKARDSLAVETVLETRDKLIDMVAEQKFDPQVLSLAIKVLSNAADEIKELTEWIDRLV